MADEIAKLVDALSGDDNLVQRLRSDSSLKSGFQKLYSVLKYSVSPIADDKSKLGLQAWDLSQIQAVAALATAVAQATRSITVEHVEPVMVAVVQKSVEFALCCLEKSTCDSDDLSVQNNMVQLLELALVDVVDKEFDLLQAYSSNPLVDLLAKMALEDDHIQPADYVKCKLQGERCLTEQKAADYLMMTLASERLQSDEVIKCSVLGQSLQHECMKMTYVTRHHANFHLECIRRLVFVCSELLGLLNSFDEKVAGINLRKILSLIVRVFKVLGHITKDNPSVKVDASLLQSFSSFAGISPKLFGIDFEFITSNAIVESSVESLAIFLMEEFLQLAQTVFLSSNVFHNIRACIAASILDHLDSRVWRYNKAAVNPNSPLVYFPRVVIYVLKLVMDVKKCGQYVFLLNDFENDNLSDGLKMSNPACQVHSLNILLLKKYSYEELLGLIFPLSSQWVDNLVHLLLFLHSEGVKLRPKFERMGSSVLKATSEPENVSCHEDDALFGDLFSEGGRSFGSVDGSDQPVAAATSVCSSSNMPSQAALELLRFLDDNVFSPDWSLKVYEDACSKLTCYHMGIFLSMINHHGHYSDDRTSDSCATVQELCFELCKKLLSMQPLSDVVEESLIEKILVVENGAYTYNDQTLSLLAYALISRSGPSGSYLRTKIIGLFVEFIVAKAKAVCSSCPSLHDLLETLPSLFHIEILLMAFHLSSNDEKVSIVSSVFSSLRTIDSPSPGYGSMQLSCWALLVSRLVLALRHMLYFPSGCPPSLLLQFKSKLREAPFSRVHRTHQSSWTPIILGKISGVWPKETPVNRSLLNQLIDICTAPAAVFADDSALDCSSLSWNELLACFSGILGLWKGKQVGNVEDLIVERYMFILCGDISVTEAALEHAVESLRGLEHPNDIDVGHLLSFRGLVLGHSDAVHQKVDFPPVMMGLLHHLHDLCMSDGQGDGGWDFLLRGSWLSLVLCLFDVGVWGFCKSSIRSGIPRWGGLTSRDAEFLALSESLVSTSFAGNKVPMLMRLFSSLLKKLLGAYEKAYLLTFDCGHSSENGFSPLLLLKQTSLDKSKHSEVCGRMGYDSCQLESFYRLLSMIGETMDTMVTEHRSRLLWEVSLHGFPCHTQISSGVLLSCILNIKGIVGVLDGLLKVEDPKGNILMETEVHRQILESVLTIKCDRVFESLHGPCEAIYKSLSSGAEGSEHSSLFIMKNLEGFLRNVNRSGADSSIHEWLITNFIDTISDLKRDTSKATILQYFLSVEDISEPSGDFSGAPRSDLLVLIDSLNSCTSESVNIKVNNFFVDLLSGDTYLDIKLKLQQKFLSMDLPFLSRWLEQRLIGSVLESSSGVSSAKASSVSFRESTMNLIMCLLPSPAEYNSQELCKHIFEAMLLPLDNAFLLFDAGTAKAYFNFMLQLPRGEMSVRPLLQRTIILMGKLGGDERHLPGLKYIFGFLYSILSECGSIKKSEKFTGRTVSSSTSGSEPLSSRQLGSRNSSDALVLSANQGATAVLDCDATSIDEDEDDGTSDGDVGSSSDKDDDEDNSSEKALASKVCTFTSSGSNFMEQHWYFCYTCDLTVSKGCCSVCAKVCHRGHRVVYSRSSRFFCDCGAGCVRGSSCQCLKPRKFTRGPDSPNHDTGGNLESFLPFPENADQVPESDSDVDEDAVVELDHSIKLSFLKEVQDGMPKFLEENDLEDRVLKLCSSMLPSIKARRDSILSRERKIDLGSDKVLSQGAELLQLKKAYKSGSLDLKIKTDYSNSKELRTHLASGSLVKSLLSVSSRGRLAVGEGDKVAIFDVGQLIGQTTSAPVTADKANVKPLSKNVVRFEIVHIIFNPTVDNYLAVAGYEDCQVLTVNHRGEVTDRLAVELALQGAYIRRLEWIPGSQVQLMVVTNKFVKIYDLSQDNFSPVHYFTLPDDMIVDVTLIMASQGRVFLIVLAESGFLYRLELSMKGNVGVKALKETIKVEGRENNSKGMSLHFSSSHKLLIVSYQDGTTLIGRLNSDATFVTEVCSIQDNEPDSKLRPAGLHHWKELLEGIGLFFCFSSLKSNAAYVVSICEREILGQNMRHAVGSTSPLVGITAYKPLSKDKVHCLILHDDGSLQIYSHVPMGADTNAAAVSEIVKKLGSGILNNKAYGGVKPEFPLDFFEKTMLITPDVKLSGDAIRNGDSEGAKQTLASEDGFLEGPSPSGFKITVSNPNPDIVMVGFRVHVGNTSANHIPSEIKVFQRVAKLEEGMRSWYDIPFTVAESLLSDEEFFISVGPTFGGSALPRIDSLEVYGRAKDEFGWKEKMDAILDMEAHMLGSNSWVSGSGRKHRASQTAPLEEQVMADGLKVLSRIYSCKSEETLNVEEANKELNKLKCKKLLETIFESDREPLLLASACRVLQALFTKKEMYHQVKDTMRLSGVVKSTTILSSKLGTGWNAPGWIIEEFTAQMRAVSKIALNRRSNLAAFLEANGPEVIDGLMQVLWGILDLEHPDTQTMNTIVVSSVELIYSYAECLALNANETGRHSVAPAVSLFKELLLSTNEAVQTSSSLAISSRLLQVPFPKQTMLVNEDISENAAPVPVQADVTSATTGSHIMVEEDNITSSVQYCCDGCSTVPILRRRWHCTICPDFDLCEACYEVLDADRLPPPHSRDHSMTAIPIEVESLGAEGSEIHFSTDDLGDPNLLAVPPNMSTQNAPPAHDLEPSESAEFSGSMFDPVTISASKRIVNSLVLSELLEQLKGWMQTTSGVRAIPVMQLFFRLSSATGGPFDEGLEPESIDLEKLVRWFLDEINLNESFAARNRSSFGEVLILVFMFFTLMLRNWNQPGSDGTVQKQNNTVESNEKSSVQILPFPAVSGSSSVHVQEKSDSVSHLLRACGILRQQTFVTYLMDILQQLVHVFKSSSVNSDGSIGLNLGPGCGSLLTIRRELPAGNFAPFFSDAYAKSHRADVFAEYPRLLLENTFRLVYSLIRPEKHDKGGEKDKFSKSSNKDLKLEGYQELLCSYINNPHTTFVRRYARRLFLHLCGSKTHYYSVRDSWQFSNEVKKLYKHVNKSGGFQSTISYERSVKIVKCLSTLAEVAAARPRNWQKYCMKHTDVLTFLMKGVFCFGEECVVQSLKLLCLAYYTGKDANQSLHKTEVGEAGISSNKSSSQPSDSKKKKKGEDGGESGSEKSYLDMEQVVDIFAEKDGETLRQFVDLFLLEWNSSSVRVEAKGVLNGIWHHGNQSFKETMLAVLLQKVKSLPMYGQNIIEYTQLVTSLLGRNSDNSSKQQTSEIIDKCLTSEVIKCIFETLRSQNELLANHPNSRIYNTLSGLVEFDGYYLESEPCVACSSPEVPYSRMKLESLKSETKFTDNRIIVKCTGSYTIQSVTMNVHDARKSKSVKVLNLYYNNRPVADLSELKNNWSLWKRAKTCHLAFNQTELKVDFPIPITACNFMIELEFFYENLQALSLEPLQCPRCSRPVTDKHGICGNCHENAYQCRQCRNINYENLDSFLCNECGYSKYGRFEFNFMAKPSFTFDSMENDEDMKRGLTAIESESENAHRRYQQLLGFKKPLLKIVSSIGENEMDSQQKDSVQQMMVSLPGPSCKINRKIALLGVLYGEKCKAAFDSVSKSVQTLQGLRRVLMNYLHLKHSDTSVASSRFVVSRSANSCYGCATTFVAQCLEMLQMLSKHPSSKKQLVSAGILTELFENNIHQGPKTARIQARAALCAFSEGDMNAVVELNSLTQKKVMYCLEHHRSMDIALATREELLLLSDVCSLVDEFWEARLRVAFQLLFSSIKLGAKHPAISEHVILPCLRIVSLACTPPKPDTADKEPVSGKSASVSQLKDENPSGSGGLVIGNKVGSESLEKNWDGSHKTQDIQLLSYSEWEKGASYLDFVRRQYKLSQAVRSGPRARPNRHDYLALKYMLKWRRRARKSHSDIASFELGSWVTELILSACSQSIRSEMCMLISLLCGQSSSRRYRLLILLMSLLPATLTAGENAAEYFELLFKMIESEDARLFVTVRGGLATLCKLIAQEVRNIESFERSLHIDISQGFILHKLIELLGKFLEVRNIRSREQLLSEVLEALIVIRGLIVQKTKLICDCNRLLSDLLDSLLLESDENKRHFIQACISGLQIHGEERNGRTSLFILEQLCNLICPSKPEAVCLLILNKAHTQEEFIRGSMTKNPYSSAEIGPLMRDVKNKICHQLDLLGLIEDDYGMELLVAGNIISLDLSVSQVYEQVWKKSNSQSSSALAGATLLSSGGSASSRDYPPMTVTYRLQGLDGEATEPMIKDLDEDREETQEPEVEFAITGAVRECGGLEVLLAIVQRLRDDLKSNQEQLVAVLNLLMLCCKTRENRRALLRLGALSLLLETARRAFSVDAMEPAEGILLIVESLTLEANESDSISIAPGVATVSSEETGTSEQAKKIVLMFLERLSHPVGPKKSGKQQRNTEMVARILPYLTYGEPTAMEALIEHFEPYLRDWNEFDKLQRQYEDNSKDENIARAANKQKFSLENFVRVSESLKTSSCGERLKDIILEKGITGAAVKHLKDIFAFTGQAGFKSSAEWQLGLKLPSVPLILSMLRGLSLRHEGTQTCIDEGGILPLLHALEGVSGENDIGARAENLLDTLSDKEGKGDGFLIEKVHQLRHATRDEMRRRALKKREELLKGMGMRQESSLDGGERIVVAQPVLEGLEDVEEEEDGLACMVCREGYRLRPTDLLGVYTYSKRVNLGVGTSGNARGDCVYTTVSHFNIIHYQCHQEAKRADAALKSPKKEWDGAALRNNETLCNNLFPLRGPSVPVSQYIRYIDQYWDYLNALGRADGSRLRLLTYDVVLMLARFATGASFSADSRGGGKESNSRFLPCMIQMARHFVDHDPSQRQAMDRAISTYLASSTLEPKTSSPGTQPSAGTEETVQFMMVTSLLSESYESWLQHRRTFLQRGIYHAYMQQTHGRPINRASTSLTITPSRPDASGTSGNTDELLPVIQPMLVYTGLIEQLQHFFKVKRSSTVAAQAQEPSKASEVEDETRRLEGWEVLMKEKLLNVKEMVGFSVELLSWLDEVTSATDLQEAFDISGVLSDVLSGGFTRCEDFVQAAIDAGRG